MVVWLTLGKISAYTEDMLESIIHLFTGNGLTNGHKAQQTPTTTEGQYLAAMLSAIKDGIIVLDNQKNVLLGNKAAEVITGLKSSDIVGKPISQVLQFIFQDKDQTAQIFEIPNFSQELTVKPRIEGAIGVLAKVSSAQIANGAGFIVAMHDIRFEKQLEEMKFGFVSIAAHELRTPLTSIKGAASVLASDYKDKYNDDQKNLISQIASNTDRLLVLVENLLNVSRIERGAVEFAPTQLDWTQTVKQIVDDFRKLAIEKNIELSFVPPTESISLIRADKIRIGEVLSNLISNAINYTNPGGKITVTMEKKANEAWTSVTDSGRGIPQESIPHLFTKFFRVSKGLTNEQNLHGTGLGLYISKAIVEMHRGRIWVTSQLGRGSTFTFALPL